MPAASPQHPTDSDTHSIPLSLCCHIGVRRSLISTGMERPASGVKCLEPKKPALALGVKARDPTLESDCARSVETKQQKHSGARSAQPMMKFCLGFMLLRFFFSFWCCETSKCVSARRKCHSVVIKGCLTMKCFVSPSVGAKLKRARLHYLLVTPHTFNPVNPFSVAFMCSSHTV